MGLYMSRTFFFDSHPPLGKQLVAAAAYLAGFDGDFKFDRIGSPYSEHVPLFALRLIPALFGSLVLPTAYHLALELGLKPWSAAIAGLMLLFGMINLFIFLCVCVCVFFSDRTRIIIIENSQLII